MERCLALWHAGAIGLKGARERESMIPRRLFVFILLPTGFTSPFASSVRTRWNEIMLYYLPSSLLEKGNTVHRKEEEERERESQLGASASVVLRGLALFLSDATGAAYCCPQSALPVSKRCNKVTFDVVCVTK